MDVCNDIRNPWAGKLYELSKRFDVVTALQRFQIHSLMKVAFWLNTRPE